MWTFKDAQYHLQAKQPDCPENLHLKKLWSRQPQEKTNGIKPTHSRRNDAPDKHKVLGSVLGGTGETMRGAATTRVPGSPFLFKTGGEKNIAEKF